MPDHEISGASTTGGLPIAPSMGPALELADVPASPALVDARVVLITLVAMGVALVAGVIAQALVQLIRLVTGVAFYGQFVPHTSPAANHLGAWVIVVPVIGGVIVGFMARYGHQGIRGHGIPEAMEQVLLNQSNIAPRLTFLKPLSAAVAIGTGGPFGAEGPIIATGGALGSVVGQLMETTAMERKTLLAAGAAAGMAATFGCPVSAVLLAVELLLFEFRPRSIIPVALASATAAAVRMAFLGPAPMFAMPNLTQPGGLALGCYVAMGVVVGVASVYVTRAVYAIEDAFDHLPIHWMWWPAIGAVAVGLVGFVAPLTMGVGYDNITNILSGHVVGKALALLGLLKFISWCISLGSGTSGGTLAPLFTIGGSLGALLGWATQTLLPHAGVDVRIAALVGMAALFAGASRALLASVVFAFETTLQPLGLLPLLGGCTAAYLVSCVMMENTIMTEKIARRGVRVPAEYSADFLEQIRVRDVITTPPVTLTADQSLDEIRAWMASGGPEAQHQGFPVVDATGRLVGVLTRRSLLDASRPGSQRLKEIITRPPTVIAQDRSLREAADHMIVHDVGRLPVVAPEDPDRVVGMITRSDILSAHGRRLDEAHRAHRQIPLRPAWTRKGGGR